MADDAVQPRPGVPLAPLTTLGIGGPADWFVRATRAEQVVAAVRWCRDQDLSLFVLGGGSNLVIADDGVKALVLQMAIGGVDFLQRHTDILVRVGAGEPWDGVVAAAVRHGLAGLECLSGIPGSTGGTPVQNVGAYGQEVSDTITEVEVFDTATMHMTTLAPAQCRFGYRTSRFKSDDSGRFVVCGVQFALRQGSPTITYPDVIDYVQRGEAGHVRFQLVQLTGSDPAHLQPVRGAAPCQVVERRELVRAGRDDDLAAPVDRHAPLLAVSAQALPAVVHQFA